MHLTHCAHPKFPIFFAPIAMKFGTDLKDGIINISQGHHVGAHLYKM